MQHVDFLCQSVRRLVQTPFSYPRFFFQTLQATNIKVFGILINFCIYLNIFLHSIGLEVLARFRFVWVFVVNMLFYTIHLFCFQLAISPQHFSTIDPVQVYNETHLTVKVEGIIQHGRYRELFRKIAKVHITASSELVNKTSNTADQKVGRFSYSIMW